MTEHRRDVANVLTRVVGRAIRLSGGNYTVYLSKHALVAGTSTVLGLHGSI